MTITTRLVKLSFGFRERVDRCFRDLGLVEPYG